MSRSSEPSTEEIAFRVAELEQAVRLHERVTSSPLVPKRPSDHALYRELRQDKPGASPPNGRR